MEWWEQESYARQVNSLEDKVKKLEDRIELLEKQMDTIDEMGTTISLDSIEQLLNYIAEANIRIMKLERKLTQNQQ